MGITHLLQVRVGTTTILFHLIDDLSPIDLEVLTTAMSFLSGHIEPATSVVSMGIAQPQAIDDDRRAGWKKSAPRSAARSRYRAHAPPAGRRRRSELKGLPLCRERAAQWRQSLKAAAGSTTALREGGKVH
jgi:hypothetical protein